jgi:hypothetical protein
VLCQNYSNTINHLLHPYFITGFADGESCFFIGVSKDSKNYTGYRVKAHFQIGLHEKDRALLEEIQNYFDGVGSIYKQSNRDVVIYSVSSITDLEVIITHFDKYPLITQKWSDYQLFRQAFKLIKRKEHLTMEGLNKIVGIKGAVNGNGISKKLKIAFPNIIPVARPLGAKLPNQTIPDPHWVAGFMSGEGCIYVRFKKSSTHKTGLQVELILQMTQHTRDEQLLLSFIDYFGCGRYRIRKEGEAGDYIVGRLSDLTEKMVPFFTSYPILGVKAKDFSDFKQVAKLMNSGAHLTAEGLEQIRQIQAGMNRGRTIPQYNSSHN